MSQAFLPLFPLQLVVFPGEQLNLHIFEPRYRQLIKECEEEGITFGIPAYLEGAVQEVGTEVQLTSVVKRYESGELDITTEGVSIFRIQKFMRKAPEKLYAGAEIEPIAINTKGDFVKAERLLEQVEELFDLLNIDKDVPENTDAFNTYDIAHHVGMNVQQEYELLCIPDEVERQDFLLEHLDRLIPTVREMENLRKRVQMNGHFKNIIPPKI